MVTSNMSSGLTLARHHLALLRSILDKLGCMGITTLAWLKAGGSPRQACPAPGGGREAEALSPSRLRASTALPNGAGVRN